MRIVVYKSLAVSILFLAMVCMTMQMIGQNVHGAPGLPPPKCTSGDCGQVTGAILGAYGGKSAIFYYEKKDNGDTGAPIETAFEPLCFTGNVTVGGGGTSTTGKAIYKYRPDLAENETPCDCTPKPNWGAEVYLARPAPASPPEGVDREDADQLKCDQPGGE